ncbi:FCD domain-containing protein [Saccharopolyspora gloriosae]|uniref:DNA-binding FadR family transcriptional regulator n=1 Tax=Saccharopolyspora gloriosae TaxID=455344 RepID=A0A840NF11_9PSEU|nr:DNA-binding FadR family transcriptional regulator [Saccharopolyspora gloriosae]
MPTPKFAPVARTRAHEAVKAQIEEKILQGQLQPGDRLPSERELCAQMGVSRPTVREAMRTLESAGVVVLRPNDPTGGAIVRMPDGANLERSLLDLVRYSQLSLGDLIGFRMLVETTACHLAAQRRDQAQIDGIVRAQLAVEAAVESGTNEEYIAADVEFHVSVARASGNRLLELSTSAVRAAMAGLIGDATLKGGDAVKRDFVRRHGAVVDAIRLGDPDLASSCARRDIVDYYLPLAEDDEVGTLSALEAFVAAATSNAPPTAV